MNIIVALPKMENAKSIKSVLVRSGFSVEMVAVTGAQALQYANDFGEGILICGPRFPDMMYMELYEYLPSGFQMLLLASHDVVDSRSIPDLMCLSMPFKINELIQTVQTMSYALERLRKKRRSMPKERGREEQALLQEAKLVLMNRNDMTEDEAHRYLQKRSMDNGTGMVETAQMILSLMQ
ncbi:MAG: ANTAR domain-containing protein [Lachnospiraceae bacterium]|nr:ANTAR domain-containing protein [Lachnospiraceae bacterium]